MKGSGKPYDLKVSAFAALLVADFVITADYAVFPAAVLKVQEELKLSDLQIGLLGTVVYGGLTLSSVLSPIILGRMHPQKVLAAAMFFSGFFTLCGALSWNWLVFAAFRFGVGLAHGPMYVYFPVWVNSNASDGVETRWMAMLQVMSPMSNIGCYALTSLGLGLGHTWRVPFAVLGVMTMTFGVAAAYSPRHIWTAAEEVAGWKWFSLQFWLLVLFGACAYFAAIAAEYWALPTLVSLGTDPKLAAMQFIAVGIAGPGFGTIFGAQLADKVGGYRQRTRALWFCASMVALSFCALPQIMLPRSSTHALLGATWALFCGSAVMPSLNGLVLESVSADARLAASGAFGFMTTAIGLTLAPLMTGYASQHGGNPLWGWRSAFIPWMVFGPIIMAYVISKEIARKSPGAGAGAGDEMDPLIAVRSSLRSVKLPA
jgi:MFS family permease